MGESFVAGTLSRYDMSYSTYRQFQRDHIRFEEEYTERFGNGFICRILINYMCYAQKFFLERFESDVVRYLDKKEHDEYFKEDRISFTKQLEDKFSEFEFSSYSNFKKRSVITFILEQFTMLALSEREIIYCYPQYQVITEVIDNYELLAVKLFSGKEYEVKPYNIKTDENTLSNYLIGYSRPKGGADEFECHSFKLSRIEKCRSRHKESFLSFKEIAVLKDINDKFGSAYIAKNLEKKNIEKTVVRLTEKGYEHLYLKVIAYQRPIPIKEPVQIGIDDKVFYDLTFDCSHQQIRNYFFSFGEEVEIISPLSLREKFMREYKASIERYDLGGILLQHSNLLTNFK